jgi:hypothetical protein
VANKFASVSAMLAKAVCCTRARMLEPALTYSLLGPTLSLLGPTLRTCLCGPMRAYAGLRVAYRT